MDTSLPPCLEVVTPGLLTTVQDLGRFGFADIGLPAAGAVDPLALRVANLLAGNEQGAPALEITVAGPELAVLRTCTIALAGADCRARLNGDTYLRPWASHLLRAGSTLSFGGASSGARAYLALAGGIACPRILGSASTYLAGALGGIRGEGRPLRAGDRLSPALLAEPLLAAGKVWPQPPEHSGIVRVQAGPHTSYFAPRAMDELCRAEWTVSQRSDRMGLRLDGPPLPRREGGELLSQGVVRGAIQVPADGLPIVLLADHQTTGGYPVVGVVPAADWPLLAQLPPGARLRFAPVELQGAQELYRRQEGKLAEAAVAMRRESHASGAAWLEVAAWAGWFPSLEQAAPEPG